MERLDEIVQAMESEQLPLEELIVRYEEGVKLVKACEAKLKAAEKRIEIISRTANGEPALETFEPEEKSGETAAATKPREDVSLF